MRRAIRELSSDEGKSHKSENLFKIIDGIIFELNRTKRLFIVMVLTGMIVPPLTFLIVNALTEPFMPGPGGFREIHQERVFLRQLPWIVSIVWLGIGIRQWLVLSKWTKKYDRYKKLQEEIDKKFDEDEPANNNNNNSSNNR
ncbi:hypothetical protein NTE_00926 [Candidatus Nitrososphaera evergladensis SR1]|uniref:Uncharacterized protein n=1 Tax=Candidatus Nitrososphaera evergladensis SR1 TaxID=1459636 RepID=A0A075MQ50_9ARCH|nr:hypothetical protein NTE_00926 [Candidatus Nitrososphaera evergladensis SR1]